MPTPPTALDLLAKQFANDAQAERRHDKKTGKPYRAWQALPVVGQPSLFHYVDIDEANRRQMQKAAVHRREQMVSDGYNLELDLEHWNTVNPSEEPIQLPMDLTLDIAIRKAADEDDDVAA